MQNSKCIMQNKDARVCKLKYLCPKIELIRLDAIDIITTSPGTETTPKDDNDGIWDLDISN